MALNCIEPLAALKIEYGEIQKCLLTMHSGTMFSSGRMLNNVNTEWIEQLCYQLRILSLSKYGYVLVYDT